VCPAAQELATGLRQMAAVLLKHHIKRHWAPESKSFEEPVVGSDEKAAIRAMLLPGLMDPASKLRTAIGMAIAGIAKWCAAPLIRSLL